MGIRLGVTGGIGSGKTTVARFLAEYGAYLIDADALSRELSASGGAAIPGIRSQFGASFLATDGSLNRQNMRELIFADPLSKAKLEAILHPLVAVSVAREQENAMQSKAKLIVFDIPLLVESGRWRTQLDKVLVVDCDTETQILRVQQRSGWALEQTQNVIATQANRNVRLAAADAVIFNQGINLDALKNKVTLFAQQFGL